MSKKSLKIKLFGPVENIDLKVDGIITEKHFKYKENNVIVSIDVIDKNQVVMNRTCNEYEIKLVFDKNKNTTSSYKLFGMNKIFELDTKTNKLEIIKDKISIKYNLEGNDFKFSLEVI